MGGSWSCALPCHLWTLCHFLPGLLYLLLHWRVSRKTAERWRSSQPGGSVYNCRLTLFCLPRGFAVTLLYGKINSEKQLEQCEQSYLPPSQIGILKVMTGSTKQFDLPHKNERTGGRAPCCVTVFRFAHL